jgi:hypothetical protein
MAKPSILSNEVKTFIVQSLACFDSPSVVAEAVKKQFGITVSRQLVENYDPNKTAGRAISERWRTLFEATRKAYLDDIANIGIVHLSVRLKVLQRLCDKAEEQGNSALVSQLLKQAALDCGGMYANRRELISHQAR